MLRFRLGVKRILDQAVVGALTLLVLFLLGVEGMSSAGALPRAALHPTQGGDATGFGRIAIEGLFLPVLRGESAVTQAGREGGGLDRQAPPVSASLWLSPFGSLDSGAGVGWCEFEKDDLPWPLNGAPRQAFHIHLAGGMMAPLTPSLGLELTGGS